MNEQQFLKTVGFIWSNGIDPYWSLVETLGEILSMEVDHFQYGAKAHNGLTLIQNEGLSIVLYAMSCCLIFRCFFVEHYL